MVRCREGRDGKGVLLCTGMCTSICMGAVAVCRKSDWCWWVGKGAGAGSSQLLLPLHAVTVLHAIRQTLLYCCTAAGRVLLQAYEAGREELGLQREQALATQPSAGGYGAPRTAAAGALRAMMSVHGSSGGGGLSSPARQ